MDKPELPPEGSQCTYLLRKKNQRIVRCPRNGKHLTPFGWRCLEHTTAGLSKDRIRQQVLARKRKNPDYRITHLPLPPPNPLAEAHFLEPGDPICSH